MSNQLSEKTQLICCEAISLFGTGQSIILNKVSFTAKLGQVLGIIGPNGSGKSSLLRCLAGLKMPDLGRIVLDGIDISSMALQERARRISYLPANPSMAWPISVMEAVSLGRYPHSRGVKPINDQSREIILSQLSALGLDHLRERSVNTLSSGEQMRVHLSRLFVTNADVILADEPNSNLDPKFQLQTMKALREYASHGAIVFLVLHDLALAANFCDQLYLLNKGEVVQAEKKELLENPKYFEEVFELERERNFQWNIPWKVKDYRPSRQIITGDNSS